MTHRHRQLSAMIEMAVRKDDRVGGLDVGGQVLIDPPGFIARALVHAHVEKEPQPIDFDQVTRPRDGSIRSAELNSHGGRLADRDKIVSEQ